ncbi:hypothetical protein [Chondromyces crocatus]|uniref:hypothetical protein n=1 Tax=Chondromyces crocatus TaxID=52 RepID=UPI0012E1E215|nr:hypothetical protein [Chondromyces crocatus]
MGAQAAEPTASDKERARSLLLDGRAKLEAGDAQAAVKAFEAAHAIMGVPTTGLDLARGLAALGRLIEARAVALEVTKKPPVAKEPAAFTHARGEAASFAEALAGRIPSLVIEVSGPRTGDVSVTVDGGAVPAQALGLSWKVDPGEHTVEAKAAGFERASRSVAVKEGETLVVALSLPADQGAEGSGGVPVWAWISGGVGLAALGAGVGFTIDYANVRSQVDRDCPGGVCPAARYDVASVEALTARWDRDLGFMVGLGAVAALGIGAAIYEVASAGGAAPADVAVVPWVGPGVAGMSVGRAF